MGKIKLKKRLKSVVAVGVTPSCLRLEYEGHRIHTDEPPARGGTDIGPPPFDSFIAMLTGCSHVILGIIAEEMDVRIEDMKMSLDTELDIRGIQGVEEIAKPIEKIDLHLDFATDASEEQVAVMKATLPWRCPVNTVLTQAGIEIDDRWTVRPIG